VFLVWVPSHLCQQTLKPPPRSSQLEFFFVIYFTAPQFIFSIFPPANGQLVNFVLNPPPQIQQSFFKQNYQKCHLYHGTAILEQAFPGFSGSKIPHFLMVSHLCRFLSDSHNQDTEACLCVREDRFLVSRLQTQGAFAELIQGAEGFACCPTLPSPPTKRT